MKLKPYEAVIEAYTNAKGELTDPVKMFYYLIFAIWQIRSIKS